MLFCPSAMEQWETILVWRFKGSRFDDHGIDLKDLAALSQLRVALVEMAKHVWREENPEAKRLPDHFEESIALKIFQIEKGSAQLAIKSRVYEEEPEPEPEKQLSIEGTERKKAKICIGPSMRKAAARVVNIAEWSARGGDPPDGLPREVAKQLSSILPAGSSDEDKIEIELPASPEPFPGGARGHSAIPCPPVVVVRDGAIGANAQIKRTASITASNIKRLQEYLATGDRKAEANDNAIAETPLDLNVTVTSADIQRNEARIVVRGRSIVFRFSPEQEERFTGALHQHKTVELHITGVGILDAKGGGIKEITAVHSLDLVTVVVPPVQMDLPIVVAVDAGLEDNSSSNKPCEETFERLVSTDPSKLLGMIASGELRPGFLTFAAEIAGRIPDSGSVIPILLRLLEHASPMVREGAIYGLASHMSEEVIARISAISQTDPVPEVQEAASGVLEEVYNAVAAMVPSTSILG